MPVLRMSAHRLAVDELNVASLADSTTVAVDPRKRPP
jgi:hypothetical protein